MKKLSHLWSNPWSNPNKTESTHRFFTLLIGLSIVLGIILRFLWASDMEYKQDEKYMFELTQKVGITEPWPLLGMPSGVGIRNPGLSQWIFIFITKIAHITHPVSLVQTVILFNSLALILLAFFIFRWIKKPEQESWIWGLALISVNPVAIQLERKIWAQSILPLFCVLFLISWFNRNRKCGAFFWGLMGALLGQIHMPGFYYAFGFFIWTLISSIQKKPYFDDFSKDHLKTQWKNWFFGSCLGLIPMLPWIQYLFANRPHYAHAAEWSRILELRYYTFWALEPLGVQISHSLGIAAFKSYIRYPIIFGFPTYAVGIAHLILIILGLYLLFSFIKKVWIKIKDRKKIFSIATSQTSLAIRSLLLGMGPLMTAGKVFVHRHYLIVTYPLQYVWLAQVTFSSVNLSRARKILIFIWCLELLISFEFLHYIHLTGGTLGEYGTAFSRQNQ